MLASGAAPRSLKGSKLPLSLEEGVNCPSAQPTQHHHCRQQQEEEMKKAQWNNASLNLFIKYLRSRSSKGGSSCYTICDGEMHAAFGDWRRSCVHRLSARACLSFDANSLYVFFYKATDSLLFQITHFHNNTTEILTATEVCESQRAWRFPW